MPGSLRSCSGNRVKIGFRKVILESNVTPNITRSSDSFSTVPPIVNGPISKQTSFTTPTTLQTQPLQTNLRKPRVPLTLIILPAPILVSTLMNSNNPILPYSHSLTSSAPHPNSQQPMQQPSSQRLNHRKDNCGVRSTVPTSSTYLFI